MVRMMVKQCPSYPAIIITADCRIRLYQNVQIISQMYRSIKPPKKGYKVSASYTSTKKTMGGRVGTYTWSSVLELRLFGFEFVQIPNHSGDSYKPSELI